MKKPIPSNEQAKADGLKRAKKMKAAMKAGKLSFTEVGKLFNISRQRAAQIIGKLPA